MTDQICSIKDVPSKTFYLPSVSYWGKKGDDIIFGSDSLEHWKCETIDDGFSCVSLDSGKVVKGKCINCRPYGCEPLREIPKRFLRI